MKISHVYQMVADIASDIYPAPSEAYERRILICSLNLLVAFAKKEAICEDSRVDEQASAAIKSAKRVIY